jgi:hypothetical protein
MQDEYAFVKSQFTVADLKGKSVEFRIPLNEKIVDNIGKMKPELDAVQDDRGFIKVAITFGEMAPDRSGVFGTRFLIPAEYVSQIIKNPSGSEYEFSFIPQI